MNYCRHCMVPTEEDACPLCGEKKLWPILPEDPCFVAELEEPAREFFPIYCGRRPSLVWQNPSGERAGPLPWAANLSATISMYPMSTCLAARELAEELFSQSGEESEEE